MPHYVLDLSRLISSSARPAPTGIDRVELAYAVELLKRRPQEVTFAAMTPWRRFGLVAHKRAERFIVALAAQWYAGASQLSPARLADRICNQIWLRGEAPLHRRLRRQAGPVIYINVSHHHLDRPASILRLKRRSNALFVPIVQDLIPIEFPEYVRPNQDAIHARRIATVTGLADAILVTTQATADILAPRLAASGRTPPVVVAPLGWDIPALSEPPELRVPEPYFVCIGTIEARKNHLLLLQLWRKMAAELGDKAPHLVIVGRRGWENENVVDMLERCPSIRGKVHEFSRVTDSEVRAFIEGARALLMPSFSEGFGLPIIEALALGVPVLCSDIPPFVEIGGGVPECFDPLDGPSWHAALVDYAMPNSARRAAQIVRLKGWAAPNWPEHFASVFALLNSLPARIS
ncbi:MAG TPA: glycosyltransferase family 1 protein [Alphaproteobacteria bacterium]|jgi:glycosyltransferase involved in cell wall biosynthesis|nr:glycosyltransferase family 1 protein [Alphaproteobacteria bacterium]